MILNCCDDEFMTVREVSGHKQHKTMMEAVDLKHITTCYSGSVIATMSSNSVVRLVNAPTPRDSPRLTASDPAKHERNVKCEDVESSLQCEDRVPVPLRKSTNHTAPDSKPNSHEKPTANRFTAAQRDRTLRHHKLIQPTSSQEKVHLASLRAERDIEFRAASSSVSSVSLLTLPEEEEEDEVHIAYNSQESFTSVEKDRLVDVCLEKNFKSALSISSLTQSTLSTASMSYEDSQKSSSDGDDDSDKEDDEYIAEMSNLYCQPCEMQSHSPSHRFVVCADTQFGISKKNINWDAEIHYSNQAIDLINEMDPRPAFVCVCGDLVDMEFSFEKKKGSKSKFPSSLFNGSTGIASREVCDSIQDEQNEDFKQLWSRLHPDIALVCLCGNHDLGNRPTPRSISRFRAAYGDEYLAFWVNGTYNIVLNNVLFVDPSGAKRIYKTQLKWLEERLKYAQDHQAKQVYVFAHHPWFLYDEDEDPENLTGASPYPEEWLISTSPTSVNANNTESFPDSYFSMPKKYRYQALELFQRYNVDACFSGHFHQNLISKTRWGMDMIITAPLSVVFESTGKTEYKEKLDFTEENRRSRKMTFESEEAMLCGDDRCEHSLTEEPSCRGVRVVDVKVNESSTSSGFRHWFVPL
ncbi:hypothetical protein HJC23_003598 [Cyclotella cryptica]|uniref:Calcineurin-like phosphoesterase domain-containing protein n=1 Tax=Cyclotella cryptica TaxID=29204 RepID=A0ABD3QJN0_9STRA|eukprot:CCRYP_004878-RA/>CCRYP_004878-RA protein AED:0.04 eAED:0.04 QI:187/1/1/1/1/1/3/29/636